jgi:hypothetical protein
MFPAGIARVACAAILVSSAACGAGASDVRGRERPLPPYGGLQAQLFDDGIESDAVGFDLDRATSSPQDSSPASASSNGPLLLERAEAGDAAVRARLTTITSGARDQGWQLGFHTIERLAGAGPLAADFGVLVEPTGPSAGIVRAFEGTLVGKTFIVFVREFARADAPGESSLHFHLTRDGSADVAALRAAVALSQVR